MIGTLQCDQGLGKVIRFCNEIRDREGDQRFCNVIREWEM